MKKSNHLGGLLQGAFASFVFEHKLQLSLFNNQPIPVSIGLFDAQYHPEFIDVVDAFIRKAADKTHPDNFSTILDYTVNQLNVLVEYQFNEADFKYQPLIRKADEVEMWNQSTFDLELAFDDDESCWSFRLTVEWGGKSVNLVFDADALLIGRRPCDSGIPLQTEVKKIGAHEFYKCEGDGIWVSSRFLKLPQWENLPCRISVEEDLLEDETATPNICSLISRYVKLPKADVVKQGQAELERLFNCTWQDYDPEYERCIPLEVAHGNKNLLWNLVAAPLQIDIMKREGSLLLISYHPCLFEKEHGIYFIFNEELQLNELNFEGYF